MDRLERSRAAELLERAREVRVLVVGDLMLDRYVRGSVDRISPEAPVPVVRVEEESSAVGGAGNVAANVGALGAACDLVGCVGRDVHGDLLRRELQALGVKTDGMVVTGERPTTVKTRVLARHQQVVRFDHETVDDVSGDLADALAGAVEELAGECQVVALEDYNKGVLVPRVADAALDVARSRKIPTVVDPKRLRFFQYPGATVFKPNARELMDALGEPIRAEDAGWMERVRRRLECENLLLTLGEKGMTLRTAEGESVRIPAVARSVYDVSGAGDTVTAVTAVILGAGGTVTEAAILANHAAALEVGKSGVETVSAAEILEHYDTHKGG